MNCQQCLDELATGSLRELTPDSAVSRHASTCPDCGPLLTQLRDREYQAATLLNNLPPISNPIIVAERAGELSRRRRMGGVVVTVASIALAVSIWFAGYVLIPDVFHRGTPLGLQTETIPLSCLSPEQAGDVINPYVRGNGRIYYIPSGVAAITVRATPSELWQIKDVLKNFDNSFTSACETRARVPAAGAGERTAAPERPEAAERPEQPELAGAAVRAKPVPVAAKPAPQKK